jgi:hypothetical protein
VVVVAVVAAAGGAMARTELAATATRTANTRVFSLMHSR